MRGLRTLAAGQSCLRVEKVAVTGHEGEVQLWANSDDYVERHLERYIERLAGARLTQ